MRVRASVAVVALAYLLTAGATWAQAQALTPYLRISASYVSPEDSEFTDPAFPGVTFEAGLDSALGASVAGGLAFPSGLRGEFEVARRETDLEQICAVSCAAINGDVTSLALMANLYYDLPLAAAVRPYVGFGAGLARVSVDSSVLGVGDDDTVPGYQLAVGLGIAVAERVTLDTGYRYFATGDVEVNTIEADYATHNFEVGVRIAF